MQSVSTTPYLGSCSQLKTSRMTSKVSRQSVVSTHALFTKKKPAPKVVVEEPPAKKSLFNFGSKKSTTTTTSAPTKKAAATKINKAEEYKKRQGFGGIISAFDFAEVRSKSDAELLYDAKYGKRAAGEKMTPEQYQALRRRVGGTAKDYWKTWIEVKGDYVDKGYVAKEETSLSTSVPGLPFLVITVLGLFGALGYVVSQTS